VTLEVAESATSSFRNDHLALAAGWWGVSPLLMSLYSLRSLFRSQLVKVIELAERVCL